MAVADSSEVVCFGGGEIYAQLIGDAERLEITEIESVLDGDVYFQLLIQPAGVKPNASSGTVTAGSLTSEGIHPAVGIDTATAGDPRTSLEAT
jgi:dihydrofolate reductase